MKGCIIVNAYSKNEEYLYQSERLKEEFSYKGIQVDIITNNSFLLYIENNTIVSKLQDYDFCIYWDKDKYILKMLEKEGVTLFNKCNPILNCDDKMITYIELTNKGIPMPKTLPGLLCYRDTEVISDTTLDLAESLGYPLIVKESYGSLGGGVYLVHDRTELKNTLEKVKCKPYLIQEYIKTSYGVDVRIIVIGKKVVGGMLRHGDNDFRSNIGSGGYGEIFEPTKEMRDLAIKVADILDLDYCGIDILFGENGPVICEVNSNAFFCSFESVTKINVAKQYVEHVIKTLNI